MVKDAFSEDHLYSQHADRVESAMGDAERLAWRQLTDTLRRCIDASVRLSASVDEIEALNARAEALAEALSDHAGTRGVALFGAGAESAPDAVSGGVPFSPVMGQLNPLAPPLVLHPEGDRVCGTVTLGAPYQGAPGLVHGAIVSAIYDEVLAFANSVKGAMGATGRLAVHFRKPTPLHAPLRFEAWNERVEERKLLTRGRCLADGVVVTEAEGLFIRTRQAR